MLLIQFFLPGMFIVRSHREESHRIIRLYSQYLLVCIIAVYKRQVQLYEFSTQEFSMTPTELTSKYNQIPLEELVKMLVALL